MCGCRIADLPDIDRLEGYDANMECDPPADYYDAYMRNEQNLMRLHKFINGYLLDTGRSGLVVPRVPLPPSCPAACALVSCCTRAACCSARTDPY